MTGPDNDDGDDENDASSSFIWDEKESAALWDALLDAKLAASGESLRALFQQAAAAVPLSAAQEAELAQRIQEGRRAAGMLADIAGRDEPPTDGQRSELMRICRDGDNARDELLKSHLALVVSIARLYAGRGTAFLDIVQVGTLGLVRAVEKFDHTKGYRLSTYASWWIRQAITRTMAP